MMTKVVCNENKCFYRLTHPNVPDFHNMWQHCAVRSPCGGSQISEFGAALVLLITCIIIPLIDLGIVPIRYGLAKSIVGSKVHQLAQHETLKQAFKTNQEDVSFEDALKRIGGVVVRSSELSLIIESTKLKGQTKTIDRPGSIPKGWLPEGANCPCIYSLSLTTNADVYPLFTISIPKVDIPGLTKPISTQVNAVSTWENLGRDPSTGEFFINE